MSNYGAAELANAFRTVRRNTIQVAEDIPEDQYDFAAAPGCKSVSAQLRHIAFAPILYYDMHRDRRITTLKGYDFGVITGRAQAEEDKPRSKADIIALLKDEGERFASWMESLSPAFLDETFTDPTGQNPKTRFESLLGPKEHEMHHRAQLMLIERIVGVVPHLTRQREERVRQRRAQTDAATVAAPA
jgi:uncharacterized damage-inducible protein DinB